MADASCTGWSSLRNVTISFANPRQGSTVEDFNWDDTMFYSLGGEWAMSDRFTSAPASPSTKRRPTT